MYLKQGGNGSRNPVNLPVHPQLAMQGDELLNRVDGIEEGVEEVTEKIYELDKSWKNNLVFYGVKCDDGKQFFC